MSETTVSHEHTFEEEATHHVNGSSQIGAPAEAIMNSAENPESSRSVRKRKRKRKQPTADFLEMVEEGDETPEVELVQAGFHSAFHGVIYDEEGNPKEITLRQDNMWQVNRKRQKRLGTCTFKISAEMKPKTANVIPAKRGRYDTTSPSSNPKQPKVNNLEVRIHKYENTYDNVVKYWYTTLDWIDKAAMELQQTEENEEYYEEEEEEEYGYNESADAVEWAIEQTTDENLAEANQRNENTTEDEDLKQTNFESLTEAKESNNTQENVKIPDDEERSPADKQRMGTVKEDANRNNDPEEKLNIGNQITDKDANAIADENHKTAIPETTSDN